MNWWTKIQRAIGSSSPEEPTPSNTLPWESHRPSIYSHLQSFQLEANGHLPDAAMTLPDEEVLQSRSGIKFQWAPGAMDGVLGHHTSGSQTRAVDEALHSLECAVQERSPAQVEQFYSLVNDQDLLRFIDPLLSAIRTSRVIQADRLHSFARWLVHESPDRAAVKLGISLLGLLTPPQDTDTLMLLGLHDEFTLYVAVALGNTLPSEQRDDTLWTLARKVDGWGRVQLVERLAKTTRADIRYWLLREGYKNSIMYEYLAYTCAVGGDLLGALKVQTPDAKLLDGAGDLIKALLSGGPAESIDSYNDGAAVVALYLAHTSKREVPPLAVYLVVSDIAEFVGNHDKDWTHLESMGWTSEHRTQIFESASNILKGQHWKGMVYSELKSDDHMTFWVAAAVAERMELDIWETRFERQRDGRGDQWFDLMRSRDPIRVDRVIELLKKQVDLRLIATGPGTDLGFGAQFSQHSALDFVLQALDAFPGKGWPLIETGLRSPVVRNRNMAIKALGAWDLTIWPKESLDVLTQAHRVEPVDDVRNRMSDLIQRASGANMGDN